MRLVWIFIGLAVLFSIPFMIWGETWELTSAGFVSWLQNYGRFAWAVALALLAADIVLPIPATAIMAGLGFVYGPVVGGIIGATGSFASGVIAYVVCRNMGRKIAIRLVGENDLRQGGGAV